MIGELTNHLWQSTLFAVVAGLLVVALRKNRARVRYALWLSASLKFFIPFSLLMTLGRRLESVPAAQEIATQIAAVSVSATVEQITEPFPDVVSIVPAASDRAVAANWIPLAIPGIWALGFGAIALMRFRAWRRIRTAVRASKSVDVRASIQVRHSPELLEPGVVGVLRPVLLLPAGILQRLTPRQLEAVLTHELCHVRRRDNLTAALHMFVEAVFWFHPLVWWIGARLVEERERACDEEVLRLGNEPTVYAEGILNVCKHYQESPLTCVSGVTGSDLKKRIEDIMGNRVAHRLSLGRALLLIIAAVTMLAGPIAVGVVQATAVRLQSTSLISAVRTVVRESAQPIEAAQPLAVPAPLPQPPQSSRETFDVISIRPAEPGVAPVGGARGGGGGGARGGGPAGATPCGGGGQITPGRITLRNTSVFRIITLAYGKNCRAANEIGLIAGLPDWVATQAFDIQATLPEGSPTYTIQQLQNGEAPKLQAMLQNMLVDRFNLALHRGTKEAALYNLVFVRAGKIKLSEDQTPPPPPTPPTGPPDPTAPPPPFPRGGFRLGVDPPGGKVMIQASSVPISTIINIFQGQEAHFVIDKTGMKGLYDIPDVTLDIGPFDVSPTAVSVWPEIMQQLGLKLESARGPLETLLIDRLEKPSEN